MRWWIAVAAMLAGCYDASVPGCLYRCATGTNACPSGLRCEADGYCKVPGEACEPPPPVAPCDPMEAPDYTNGVFVSTRGAPTGAGDAISPVDKIALGIAIANAQSKPRIYVDEGTYDETLEIADNVGVTIDAGWIQSGLVWSRDCSADRVMKTLVKSAGTVGVTFTNVIHSTTLANLSIQTTARAAATPADMSGASRIGVLVRGDGSAVTLFNVLVVPGDGDHGGPASAGAEATTTIACDTVASCTNGAVGAEGAAAADASSEGTFGPDGYTPADGAPGVELGAPGASGTPGEAEVVRTDCNRGCGCGVCFTAYDGTEVAQAGKCGCGGNGGNPGAAGRGGGASIGVLVSGTNAIASIEFSLLRAGSGGDGSEGGLGGAGAAGTAGMAGTGAHCHRKDCVNTCPSCQYNPDTSLDGIYPVRQPGGPGGAGGAGARGGGGGGGPSYAVVTTGGARAIVDRTSVLLPGTGGLGGNGAVAGAAAPELQLP